MADTQSAPFTIYDASAGSGKTFTVVRNYIAALLCSEDDKAYRKILAVTFTNKAVAEMKSRIIDSLRGFAQPQIAQEHLGLFEAVKALTQLTDTDIQFKSARILKTILHNYAGFDISTIDGFTQRLLRTFAKDLDIPLNFEIEMDTTAMLEEAVDRLIAKAGVDEELTKVLINYAITKADDDRSWDISKDLYEIAKLLVAEDNFDYLEQLQRFSLSDFSEFTKELRESQANLKEEISKITQLFFECINHNGLEEKDFTRKYVPKYFKKIQDEGIPGKITSAKWKENIATDPLYNKTQTEAKKQLMDGLQSQIAARYKATEEITSKFLFYKEILKTTPALSLLAAIDKELQAIKTERNILLIAEFNRKISESIAGQPAPFIYERLGDRYDTYYIDEFQDTSVLQWQNLIPLLSESLSNPQGKVTLVGDAKQSIYRWRGGRAEQFMALCNDQNPFRAHKLVEKLPDNYRSKQEIVAFNNAFFEHVAETFTYEPYKNLFRAVGQNPKKDDGGYVHLEFIEAKNVAEENELYPEKIVQIIQHLQREYPEDYPLYKDICILVRKKAQGIAIANYLTENDIPIISSETLLLSNSSTVTFMANLLELSLNTADKTLKFNLLNALASNPIIAGDRFAFTAPRLKLEHQDFFDSLRELNIYFDLQKFKRLPLYDAVEYGLRCFNLLDDANAYIQFFLDFTYDYTQKYAAGVAGFVDLWKRKKDSLSIIAPDGGNAVQIMTIHKSKGLEFPIVIYPYANEQMDNTTKDQLWIDISEEQKRIPLTHLSAKKDLVVYSKNAAALYEQLLTHKALDTANLSYVALTRAEQQLCILSKYDLSKGAEKPNFFSGLLIQFLKANHLWQEGQLAYAFGKITPPTPAILTEESPKNIIIIDQLLSTPPESHALDLITRSGQLWGSEQEHAITEGNILHELLRHIKYPEDISKALIVAQHKGLLLNSEIETYQRQLSQIVQHPQLARYFSEEYRIFTEKEIVYQGEFKRLDRLCIHHQDAVIIDYKTGKEKQEHLDQINTYAQAISDFGYHVTHKLLIYLEDRLKIKVIA